MPKVFKKRSKKSKTCKYCPSTFWATQDQTICTKCRPFIKNKVFQSKQWKWMIKSIIRSGYMDVINDVNLAELFTYHKLATSYRQYYFEPSNGVRAKMDIEICHLIPSNEINGRVGKLSTSNLVAAPKTINRRLGTTYFHNVGDSVEALNPVPSKSKKKLWAYIRDNADLTGLLDFKFTFPTNFKQSTKAWSARGDFSYSDILKAEAKRLDVALPRNISILNGFLLIMRGMFSDIPFTLDKDFTLYATLDGESDWVEDNLDFARYDGVVVTPEFFKKQHQEEQEKVIKEVYM